MENQVINEDVLIEHTFNASAEKVFGAWVSPDKLMHWYAPDGCTVKFESINVKTGGRFHSCISHPQFGDCWAVGEYVEVSPNKKLVFTLINADENGLPINPTDIGMDADWPGKTLVTVIFTEENGKTLMQLHQTVSLELAKKTGAYPSWIQMFNKMETIL